MAVGQDARTLDLLGGGAAEGSLDPITGRTPFDPMPQQQRDALANQYAVRLPAQQTGTTNATVYNPNQSQSSSPLQQLSAYLNGNVGGVTGAYNASRAAIGTPNALNAAGANPANANAIAAARGIPTVPQPTAGMAQQGLGAVPSIGEQINSARQTGAGFLGLANNVMGQTGQQATSLFGQGQGYQVSAPQITAGGNYQTPVRGGLAMEGAPTQGLATGPGGSPLPGGGSVLPPAGGGGPHIVGGPGAGPATSSVPQFTQGGAAPAPASAGAAPALPQFQVGARGAAPGMVDPGALGALGSVAGQLGNQGASSADQQSMLARLNGVLNAPQGPSVAEAQLRQAQAQNAAQLIGLARSGRGGPGDQAEALREAISAGSGLMSDTAGQIATLRAQEEDMRRNRELSGIGLGGQLATAQRGQDLGLRGQDLAALQSDQGAQLGARGQTLAALQGNQGTQLGARGQDLTARAQDLGALTSDADRQLAAQGLALQGQLGLTGLGLQAQGQGLQYSSQQNALGLGAEGMAQDAINRANQNAIQLSLGNQAADNAMLMQRNELNSRPGFLEQLGLNIAGGVGNALGGGIVGSIFGGGGAPAPAPAPAAAPNPYLYTVPYAGSPQYNANNYTPGPYGGAGGVY